MHKSRKKESRVLVIIASNNVVIIEEYSSKKAEGHGQQGDRRLEHLEERERHEGLLGSEEVVDVDVHVDQKGYRCHKEWQHVEAGYHYS